MSHRIFCIPSFSDKLPVSDVTRVKARVMIGVTAIIGSDLDGRQILHDTPC